MLLFNTIRGEFIIATLSDAENRRVVYEHLKRINND